MIGLEDRTVLAQDIGIAQRAGARLGRACAEAGITVRTLQRWKAGAGLVTGDRRPGAVRPVPAHALSAAEKQALLRVANEPRFPDKPPARIVPALADEGVYLASESSMQRVLRAHGQTRHRGRAKAPRASRAPSTHVATAPRQLWCWDMTYLPTQIAGRWFYFYLILDACRAHARADELRTRAEEIDAIDERARPVLVRQSRRERGLDCLPRHALRQHGQRMSKIDHLIEPAAEEIVGGQCAKPRSDRCGKLSGSATDYSSFREFTPPAMDRKSSAGTGLQRFAGPTSQDLIRRDEHTA